MTVNMILLVIFNKLMKNKNKQTNKLIETSLLAAICLSSQSDTIHFSTFYLCAQLVWHTQHFPEITLVSQVSDVLFFGNF